MGAPARRKLDNQRGLIEQSKQLFINVFLAVVSVTLFKHNLATEYAKVQLQSVKRQQTLEILSASQQTGEHTKEISESMFTWRP